MSSAGYNPDMEEPLYTVGANGYLVDKIMTVKELMEELTGQSEITNRVKNQWGQALQKPMGSGLEI